MSLNGTMAPMYSPIKSLEENSNHDEGIFTVLIFCTQFVEFIDDVGLH